jgi:anti-sigma-K factor RskA
MSDDHTIHPGDGDILAAEYVLGVLGAAERRGVERRLAQDPVLASEVAFWEERLCGLTDAVEPAPPPLNGWSRIEAAVAAETAAAPQRPSLWQSLALWRSLTAVSATLAAASIAAFVYVALVPASRGPLLATLGGSAGQPNFVASVTAQGNNLVIVPAALLTNDPRAYELWLIPAGETRPHSLGLIQPGQPVRLDLPADLAGRVTPQATLAVSIEPPGGSPTGQPTGPVIASGKLTNL